jgi:hypothetical protein
VLVAVCITLLTIEDNKKKAPEVKEASLNCLAVLLLGGTTVETAKPPRKRPSIKCTIIVII